MTAISRSVPNKEFIKVWDHFYEMATTKQAHKIDYSTYKRIKSQVDIMRCGPHNPHYGISLCADTEKQKITLGITHPEPMPDGLLVTEKYVFPTDEPKQFGRYLYLMLIQQKEAEKMTPIQTWNTHDSAIKYPKETEYIIGYDLDTVSGVSNYGVLDISAKDICHNGVSIVDAIESKASKSDVVGIVEETIERIFNENKNDDEENKNMKNFNFDFGPVDGSQVRMSIYGMAVKNASGTWVAYDKNTGDIMDVDVFNFDGGKFFYKMPVAVDAVRMGDVVIHARKPMIVKDVSMSGVVVIDVIAGEEKTILPTKSPFGFNFIIRVASLFDMNGATIADAQNPFGNMLPFFLMGEGKEIDPMMFMLMGNQQFTQNPMMMYFLMKDNGAKDDMLPFLFMMNSAVMPGNATAAPALAQD